MRADADALREAMRAKRGRNGEDRPRREKREKRPRTERVYKCRRTNSGCVAVFPSKEEREEHYAKVHNFVRRPGDLDKKKLRCPLGHCPHRYTTKPQLEEHLNAAHSTFVERLDVPLLVRTVRATAHCAVDSTLCPPPNTQEFCVYPRAHHEHRILTDLTTHLFTLHLPTRPTHSPTGSHAPHSTRQFTQMALRMKKDVVKRWRSPIRGDRNDFDDVVDLNDYLEEEHAELRIQILRQGERRKIIKRIDERMRHLEQLKREAEEAAFRARGGYIWKDKDLALLTPGTLVWARFRDYPFWPGLVDEPASEGKIRMYADALPATSVSDSARTCTVVAATACYYAQRALGRQ
jgi:hypothetical protein